MAGQSIHLKTRQGPVGSQGASGSERQIDWLPSDSAVIICDMWDAHHCISAQKRTAEMAPRLNHVVALLRDRGALVIHAPSSCMNFYSGTPQRTRAREAAISRAPVPFDWNDWDWEKEDRLPQTFVEPGPCSCDTPEPCCEAGPPYPWTRQIETIEVASLDAVTDDGQEVFNLLEGHEAEHVFLMGVHTNLCVLGRPFGIRQLVYSGKEPILCRDLTDSFHRDPRGHFEGTQVIVEHIERFWCPTVTSDQLVGGSEFRFKRDGRGSP